MTGERPHSKETGESNVGGGGPDDGAVADAVDELNEGPRLDEDEPDLSTYDLVLAAVPTPLLVGGVVGVLLAVPLLIALAVGSVGSAGVIGYTLFLDPP